MTVFPNAEERAAEHAHTTLVAILAEHEVPHNKIKRWKQDGMYFWKCYCGSGMRYMNEVAMRNGSISHRQYKHQHNKTELM